MNIQATAAVSLMAILVGHPAPALAAPPTPTVSVTARGQARVVPDLVEIRLGVSTQAPQLAEAKRDNDKKTVAALAVAKKFAVPNDDIELNVHISPIYEDR